MRISDWSSDVCSSDLLVPPNPKEFDSARRTGRSFAAWGVRSMSAQLGEGLSRLRVGGTTLSRIARIEKIASTAPAAPSRWPIADLVDDIDTFFTASPNNRRTAPTSISPTTGAAIGRANACTPTPNAHYIA